MQNDEILVQVRAEDVRLGRLLERNASGYVVAWDDEPAPVTMKTLPVSVARVAVGSLRHRALIDPKGLAKALAEEPELLFVSVLRERRQPMKPSGLASALKDIGFDAKAVSAAWRRAKPGLDRHPHVRAAGTPATYAWSEEPLDYCADLRRLSTPLLLERLVLQTTTDKERAVGQEILADRTATLLEMLAAAGLGMAVWPSKQAIEAALDTPLTSGQQLAAWSDRLLRTALDEAGKDEREDVLWLLATTCRPVRILTGLAGRLSAGAAAPDSTCRLLASLTAELTRTGILKTDPQIAAALLGRITPLVGLSVDTVAGLLDLIRRVPGQHAAGRNWLIGALDVVNSCPEELLVQALRGTDPAPVLAAAAAAPLSLESGRVRLITIANRIGSDAVSAPATWEGVQAQDLAALISANQLVPVLGRPSMTARRSEIVTRAVQDVATRAELAEVLLWPPLLLEGVAASVLTGALRRAGERDPLFSRSLDGLTNQARLDQLRDRATAADAAAAATAAELQTVRERASAERLRVLQLETRLREIVASAYDATGAQRRQLRIDGLRAAVELLEEVDRAADASGVGQLREGLLAVAARHGIEQIGRTAVRVPFDRELHELVAGPEQPVVTVLRSGYRWAEGSSMTVLVRAVVSSEG